MCHSLQELRISAYLQMIIGVFSICFGFVEIGDGVKRYYFTNIVPIRCLSIWMGLWFLIGGIDGVVATRYNSTRLKVLVIVYLFFCIMSTALAGLMTACYIFTIKYWKYSDTHYPAPFGIACVVTILGGIEVVVSLWALVCSCNIIGGLWRNQSQNSVVQAQAVPHEYDRRIHYCATGYVIQGHDNRIIATTGGPNIDLDGTPEYFQTEVTRNEEFPPSYEIAMQNSNFIAVNPVNIEGECVEYEGPPPAYQFSVENGAQAGRSTTELSSYPQTLDFQAREPPPQYQA